VRYLGSGAERFGRSGRLDRSYAGGRRGCLGAISDRNPFRQHSNSPEQHSDAVG